eukprot:1152084-Pelagomonas_calceolata.AAC.16
MPDIPRMDISAPSRTTAWDFTNFYGFSFKQSPLHKRKISLHQQRKMSVCCTFVLLKKGLLAVLLARTEPSVINI